MNLSSHRTLMVSRLRRLTWVLNAACSATRLHHFVIGLFLGNRGASLLTIHRISPEARPDTLDALGVLVVYF